MKREADRYTAPTIRSNIPFTIARWFAESELVQIALHVLG